MNEYDVIPELIRKKLLEWWKIHGRHDLPWKKVKVFHDLSNEQEDHLDPYSIWIAEVMLQQTQLKVMLPYWERWMEVFPTCNDLAEASLDQLLFIWQGLGYYSRAKRLHHAAKQLQDSPWPRTLEEWMALPGIGRSTAGSILSSAFNSPYPILDGNVKRILARLIASEKAPIKDETRLWELSSHLLDRQFPRDFNQALMDLGAIICTVRNPDCCNCPLNESCLAFREYDPINFPKKYLRRSPSSVVIGIGIIFNNSGQILIDQRLEDQSMGGMWEFPGGKQERNETIEETIAREILEELGIQVKVGKKLIAFNHSYTHKRLHFVVHLCEFLTGIPRPLASQKLLWVEPKKLVSFPFPSANKRIIASLFEELGLQL